MSVRAPLRAGACARGRTAAATSLAAVLASGILAAPAAADVVVLEPVKDGTLFEHPAGLLASGSGDGIFAGRISQPVDPIRRALIDFDVASAIPAGSTVTGVRLTLTLSATSAGPVRMTLHRALAEWGEGTSASGGGGGRPSTPGDATWLHRFYDDQFWAQAGGDFEAAPAAAAIVDQPGVYSWAGTLEMAGHVQDWLDHPEEAHGWILVGDESRPQTVKRFDSREHPEAANRPLLEVAYDPPCVPWPAGLGFWKRQCAGPDADAATGACASALLAWLGLPGVDACGAILEAPPQDCQERALRKLAILALNVCADRLQTSCPVAPGAGPCESLRLDDLLFEIAAKIREGDCRAASGCAGLPD